MNTQKPLWKRPLVFVSIGLLLMLIAYALVGFQLDSLGGSGAYEARSQHYNSTIQAMELDVGTANVEFVKSTDGISKVTCYENKNHKFTVEESGGVLRVKQNSVGFLWFDIGQPRVTVEVPEQVEITMKSTNGSTRIADFALKSFDYEQTNGDLKAQNLHIEGDCTLRSTNGSLELSNSSAGKVDAESSNGGIVLEYVKSRSSLRAKATNAKLHLENIEVGTRLDAKTTNGDIDILLQGRAENYSISAKTTNGSSNTEDMQRSDASKSVHAETTNGDIHIAFTER